MRTMWKILANMLSENAELKSKDLYSRLLTSSRSFISVSPAMSSVGIFPWKKCNVPHVLHETLVKRTKFWLLPAFRQNRLHWLNPSSLSSLYLYCPRVKATSSYSRSLVPMWMAVDYQHPPWLQHSPSKQAVVLPGYWNSSQSQLR